MRTFELRVYKLRTKEALISTEKWFIPVISPAFRNSGLRRTAFGPRRRMSNHGFSCWSPMRRAKNPAGWADGICKAQNSLTTRGILMSPTSWGLKQQSSYLQQAPRSSDGIPRVATLRLRIALCLSFEIRRGQIVQVHGVIQAKQALLPCTQLALNEFTMGMKTIQVTVQSFVVQTGGGPAPATLRGEQVPGFQASRGSFAAIPCAC